MPKQITERKFELRTWQAEAEKVTHEKYKSSAQDYQNFLCVATPGSGKTKLGLLIAHNLFRKKIIDRLVVVTPTTTLTKQWASEAAYFAGIDLDPDFTNHQGCETSDFHGIAITYALLAQDKKGIHAQNTFDKRTFVILDEPHHMGDSLAWGESAQKAFEGAVFRFLISGTPFRSDDCKIPFVTYDETNTSIADYTYSYERAILDNVCRQVYFTIHDGRMKWKVDKLEFNKTFKDFVEKDQVSKRLRTALDHQGNFIRDVFRAADLKLTELRKTHANAGGLIFAVTQSHAKQIAKVVEEITGELPPVVISEDADGTQKIQQFKHSNWRWMVSVKMVSEGIDIPRLRIGCYFTNVKADLFFRQLVGRFVRVQKELGDQEAYIFIPQDKDIVKLAETIQEEREHALDQLKSAQESSSDKDLWGNQYTPALKGKFEPLASDSIGSKTIAVAVEVTTARYGIDHQRIEDQNPVYVQKETIKKRLNDYAKKYALKHSGGNGNRPDFKLLHKKYLEAGGKHMDLQTVEELKSREQYYISQLRSN